MSILTHSYTIRVKFEPDAEAVSRLEGFDAAPDEFEWDEGNRKKNLKHAVTTDVLGVIFERGDLVKRVFRRLVFSFLLFSFTF